MYKKNIKIIYFSTNYVYPGLKGKYTEESFLNPSIASLVKIRWGVCSANL